MLINEPRTDVSTSLLEDFPADPGRLILHIIVDIGDGGGTLSAALDACEDVIEIVTGEMKGLTERGLSHTELTNMIIAAILDGRHHEADVAEACILSALGISIAQRGDELRERALEGNLRLIFLITRTGAVAIMTADQQEPLPPLWVLAATAATTLH